MPDNSTGLEKIFFWLGFIAAGLLGFLVIRYRSLWPKWKEFLYRQINSVRARFTAGAEEALRQAILRRTQGYHLSGSLFSLNDIAITPHMLAPPPQATESGVNHPRKFYPQLIGYLPEAPLFAAHYGAPRLTIVQALEAGVNIAISGEAGAGKSLALAYVASLIARQDPRAGQLAHLFPLFLHAHDLHPLAEAKTQPEEALVRAAQFHAHYINAARLRSFIHVLLEGGRALLLLDGLDELSPPEFELACDFLSALLTKYPRLRIVTATHPHLNRRMLSLGIEPMALSGWNRLEARHFIRNWVRLWRETLAGWKADQTFPLPDDLILSSWLVDMPVHHTPGEWTFKAWAACAGNLEGSSCLDAISSHLRRELEGIPFKGLSAAANEMISLKTTALPAERIETLLTSGGQSDQGRAQPARLLALGIFRKHPGERLAFSSPWLAGYFASLAEEMPPQPPDPGWSVTQSKAGFSLSQQRQAWLTEFLREEKPPYFDHHVQASAWLKYIPQNHENKITIIRGMLRLIQRTDIPIFVRLILTGNLATCNDPSMPLLFKQWLTLNSPALRRLALLGLGASSDGKWIDEIAAGMEAKDEPVRQAACCALAALDLAEARAELQMILEKSDETSKQVTAECLTAAGPGGYDIIKKAAASDDLLIRRAAVYGLSLISEPWVIPLLEKIATEDTHWVVRNAAALALDTLKAPDPSLPKPRLKPHEAPWLIKFAARSGRSVSIQEPPIPLLRQALATGTIVEQIFSMWMVRDFPDPQLIAGVEQFLNNADTDLRETAHYVLWQLGSRAI